MTDDRGDDDHRGHGGGVDRVDDDNRGGGGDRDDD